MAESKPVCILYVDIDFEKKRERADLFVCFISGNGYFFKEMRICFYRN